MYLCTFCTFTCCIHAHVLVCSGVLCESRSLKTIEGLMDPPFTFKIPEVYRRCTVARLFLSLCYYKDIFVDIHELTQTETVLKLDLCSLVGKQRRHSLYACWDPETAQLPGHASEAAAPLRSWLWPPPQAPEPQRDSPDGSLLWGARA